MQRATVTGIRVRSPADARTIFHSVSLGILPMVTRRLDTEERSLITAGSVYVWEERGPHTELIGVGIERWTDGIRWGPSRVREGFLFYHEKPSSQQLYAEDLSSSYDPSRSILIKQTYTVFVDTSRGQRKWHLIAYFTEDTIDRLQSIDNIPQLASLSVPHGKYRSARSAKGRPDQAFNPESESPVLPRLEYAPYAPRTSSSPPSAPNHLQDRWIEPSSPQDSLISRMQGSGSSASSDNTRETLVPLSYLQDHPPPRRHPMDEKILMLLTSRSSSFDIDRGQKSSTPILRPGT